ncbi:hypothetical protein FBEOM_11514 [Fusarium beomiforme]|uniref:Uncharacterized protein n=1 Tax=Fusarium beomiforme TaxID=44412 RepID=A0A9P5DUB2_9HYPO|nr:hypothetical protein FBEOM_11514 [Fusarium beomiforme]
MNDTFTLPVRSRPLALSARYTPDSYVSYTISETQSSGLKAQKRAPVTQKTLENLENNGAFLPITHRDHLREETLLDNVSDDRIRSFSTSEEISDQASVLQMVRDTLRHERSQSPSPESKHGSGPRRTSSSYPDLDTKPSNAPSPASDTRIPRLDLGDLTKYSRINDRLSCLRSSSSSSAAAEAKSQEGTKKGRFDAASAFEHLQRLPTSSYHRFEIVSSSEDLPSNALTPQSNMAIRTSLEETAEPTQTYAPTRVKAQAQTRFDGLTEIQHPGSPSPSIKPPQMESKRKRKASTISLRSWTESVKRSRVEVKKLAHNIRHSGCNKIRQACQNIKRQHKEQKKHYSVWKALRHKFKREDAIKDKHEKEPGTFSIEKSKRETESWWKAGVDKYHAPKWMRFGK